MTLEGSIIDLSQKLFQSDPQAPHSISVQFPDHDLKSVAEDLLQCLTEGLKYFYGNSEGRVDLNQLSLTDFNLVDKYFNSFGISVVLNKYDESDYDLMIDTHFSKNNLINLPDFRFKLKVDSTIYVIYFNFLDIH